MLTGEDLSIRKKKILAWNKLEENDDVNKAKADCKGCDSDDG